MKSPYHRLFITLSIVLTLGASVFAFAPAAHAQDGTDTIRFNEPEIVTLQPNVTVNRAFDALAGDTVEIVLSRLSEFEYTAVLIGPDSAPIGLERQPDGNVLASLDLTQGGRYTLALQATDGSGQMLIQVNSTTPTPLAMGETLTDIGATPVRFSLEPSDPATGSVLALSTVALRGAETLPRMVLTRSSDGAEVLSLNPDAIAELTLRLPAGESFVLSFEGADITRQVRITWTSGDAMPDTVGLPDGTSSMGSSSGSSSSGSSSTGACQVYFGGAVNARSGPGTNYAPPIAQVPAGTTLNVTGHNGDRSWYQVDYNGQRVWVAMFVAATEERGDCSTITVASYPAPPVVAAPPTSPPSGGGSGSSAPTPTTPPSGGGGSGSGGGGGTSPTSPPPPTATPNTPTAPPDANSHTFNVDRDGTSQFQEVISYPNGDTEDRIFVKIDLDQSINNQTRNVIFTLVCNGSGTEYVRWGTYPNTAGLRCGDSSTRFFTYDSEQATYYVQFPEGSGSGYVNYTLLAVSSK